MRRRELSEIDISEVPSEVWRVNLKFFELLSSLRRFNSLVGRNDSIAASQLATEVLKNVNEMIADLEDLIVRRDLQHKDILDSLRANNVHRSLTKQLKLSSQANEELDDERTRYVCEVSQPLHFLNGIRHALLFASDPAFAARWKESADFAGQPRVRQF